MYTNTGSLLALSLVSRAIRKLRYGPRDYIIPYLCAAPCPVFRANPQPERESDIGAPVDQLPAPVQLSGVYPSAAHVSRSHRLSASKFRSLSTSGKPGDEARSAQFAYTYMAHVTRTLCIYRVRTCVTTVLSVVHAGNEAIVHCCFSAG